MEQKQNRSSFSGKIGFVLSAAGASVGLGNIWRFPYLAAKYGGGIFLLIYIVLALTFGYSMIMAETALGRMTGKSPVGAYASFAGKGRKNGFLGFGGWINAIIPVLIVPYYSVIGGWGWLRMATSAPLLRTVPPQNSAFCSLRSSRWASSLRACATAWSAFPGL